MCFYTHGSKSDNRTNGGFVVDDVDKCVRMPHEASVSTSELYAIFRCLDLVSKSRAKRLAICTDLLSSLQALKSFYL